MSVEDGGSKLLSPAGSLLRDAADVGALLHGASASVDGGGWSANGLDLIPQAGDFRPPLAGADLAGVPTWEERPAGDVLVDISICFDTRFLPEEEIDP